MKKIILFGATPNCKKYISNIPKDILVLAVADNNKSILHFAGHKVIIPEEIVNYKPDLVIITLDDLKKSNENEIQNIYMQLLSLGISDEKIILQSFKYKYEHPNHKPRTNFIECLGKEFKRQKINGAIAECGVYRGWFSGILSEIFETQEMYLFDSFEGFGEKDIVCDSESAKNWIANGAGIRLSNANERMVELRILNRKRLHILKGYIPDTLSNIKDKFMFVNLDMDLYKPQSEALNFFAERMVKGGVILLHDYFNELLPGTAKAIEEFRDIDKFICVPIGDELSIALIRK